MVIRYVKRNALRAKLVKKAENWDFSSLARRISGNTKRKKILAEWPIPEPRDYLSFVNTPQTIDEEERIRASVVRGKPFGVDAWALRMIKKFGLESTVRSTGRPKKGT